jgi:DNA-binding winged helix-turn-helix (wHTH) protein
LPLCRKPRRLGCALCTCNCTRIFTATSIRAGILPDDRRQVECAFGCDHGRPGSLRGGQDKVISFGPFRLFPTQQLLLENEKPLRLGSRAFDLLSALIQRAGKLVTKEELVAKVWPNTFVEESNLRVHMAALRRTLGDGQAGNRSTDCAKPGYAACRRVRFVPQPAVSKRSKETSIRSPHRRGRSKAIEFSTRGPSRVFRLMINSRFVACWIGRSRTDT